MATQPQEPAKIRESGAATRESWQSEAVKPREAAKIREIRSRYV
jgi:hypothetical protein